MSEVRFVEELYHEKVVRCHQETISYLGSYLRWGGAEIKILGSRVYMQEVENIRFHEITRQNSHAIFGFVSSSKLHAC